MAVCWDFIAEASRELLTFPFFYSVTCGARHHRKYLLKNLFPAFTPVPMQVISSHFEPFRDVYSEIFFGFICQNWCTLCCKRMSQRLPPEKWCPWHKFTCTKANKPDSILMTNKWTQGLPSKKFTIAEKESLRKDDFRKNKNAKGCKKNDAKSIRKKGH